YLPTESAFGGNAPRPCDPATFRRRQISQRGRSVDQRNSRCDQSRRQGNLCRRRVRARRAGDSRRARAQNHLEGRANPAAHVRVIYVEAAGCYGHNAADDAAADAALLSQAVGKPVRVQWMRNDEHAWEPLGPAMVMEVRGGLDQQGNVIAWDFQGWTPTHSSRPNGSAGSLLAGTLTGNPSGTPNQSGADRNANHSYN